jgi:4-hydroxybenzoate polyprenyltransferase
MDASRVNLRRRRQTRPDVIQVYQAKVRNALSDTYLFIRFSVLNFSAMLPLLGAATVAPILTGSQMLGLIAVALAFHIFAYVLNDVIDLPVDRSEPLRQGYPLVRGGVQPRRALAFALLQIPLALLLTTGLGGDAQAYGALITAFAFAVGYDLWGKRTAFPPLSDALVGLACSAFALYGTFMTNSPPTALTGILLAYVFVFALMINGVHGALRDLANDIHAGARTTAIFLGAYSMGSNGIALPGRLVLYTAMLQSFLVGVSFLPLVHNWFDYGPVAWRVTTGVMLLFAALSLVLLGLAMKSVNNKWNMIMFGVLHMILSMGSLVMLFAFHMEARVLVLLPRNSYTMAKPFEWTYAGKP